jgi:hypothetical protein
LSATIRPATDSDIPSVTRYLARSLGGTANHFQRYFAYRWLPERPNIGSLIEEGGVIRGFIGVIYADRVIGGDVHRFGNLTSIAVDETHRKLSLKLFSRVLSDRSVTFTSLSPSSDVVEILRFFKFEVHAVEKNVLGPVSSFSNIAWWHKPQVIAEETLTDMLTPHERQISRDHRGTSTLQLLLKRGSRACFVLAVRRGHRVRAYTEIVYASDPQLLLDWLPWLQLALMRHHGTLVTMIESRWLPRPPELSIVARKFRPLVYRSASLGLNTIDALYTELCLQQSNRRLSTWSQQAAHDPR